jgi:ABC-type xylose transport system permease subunit
MWSKAVEWVRVQWARALKHWPWLLAIVIAIVIGAQLGWRAAMAGR